MNNNQKGFANIVLVIAIVVLAGLASYFVFGKKVAYESYRTSVECTKKTNLPCKHYFVGDFGQEWRPSPYRSKDECENNEHSVGLTCVIPPGNFREVRWVPVPIDATKNWQTYYNTKYGYELKYPEGVTIEAYNAKSSWPATGKDDSILVGNLLEITPLNGIGKCSDLRNEQAIITCLNSVSWAKQDHWAPVTISGLPAVRRETTLKPFPATGSDIAPVGYNYYVNNGNTGLQISFQDSLSRRPLMDQILSTFKFLK